MITNEDEITAYIFECIKQLRDNAVKQQEQLDEVTKVIRGKLTDAKAAESLTIEQKFFNALGIEPSYNYIGHYPETDNFGRILPPKYPEITKENILNLICILSQYGVIQISDAESYEDIKEYVLKNCINFLEGSLSEEDEATFRMCVKSEITKEI